MKALISFCILCITLTYQQKLYIEVPGTMYISDLGFNQSIRCTNGKGGTIVPCFLKFQGLPEWLEFSNNGLKIKSQPKSDEIKNVIIMAEDNSGRNTSRIVVLYVDYNYQQGKKTNTVENNVVERSQTVTNNRQVQGPTILNQKQTASSTKTTKDKSQTQLAQKNINLTLVVHNTPVIQIEDKNKERQQKVQFDQNKYLTLLNRQAKAHEKVAYYLALLRSEQLEIKEIRYKIQILETRKIQIFSHEQILIKEIEEWKRALVSIQGQIGKQEQIGEQSEEKIEQLQGKISAQKRRLQLSMQQLRKVRVQLGTIEQQINKINIQLQSLRQRVRQQQRKCTQVNRQIDQINRNITIKQRNVIDANNRIKVLQRQQSQYVAQIQRLKRQMLIAQNNRNRVSKDIDGEKASLRLLQLQIQQSLQRIKALQEQCSNTIIKELNIVINRVQLQLKEYNNRYNQLQTQIQQLQTSINKYQSNISQYTQQLEKEGEKGEDYENGIQGKRSLRIQIQTKILRLTQQIQRSKNEKEEVNRQIKIHIDSIKTNEEEINKIQKELKKYLIEKQIVDGLIRKIIVNQNQVINDLGFTSIFQYKTSLPSSSQYKDIQNIQRQLQQSTNLHEVNLVPGTNLKEQEREQCQGLRSAQFYGSGTISKINGNEFEVTESDGTKYTLKIFSCSLNLSPIKDYKPQIGDLICWRAFQFNDQFVIVESLVFKI